MQKDAWHCVHTQLASKLKSRPHFFFFFFFFFLLHPKCSRFNNPTANTPTTVILRVHCRY